LRLPRSSGQAHWQVERRATVYLIGLVVLWKVSPLIWGETHCA